MGGSASRLSMLRINIFARVQSFARVTGAVRFASMVTHLASQVELAVDQ